MFALAGLSIPTEISLDGFDQSKLFTNSKPVDGARTRMVYGITESLEDWKSISYERIKKTRLSQNYPIQNKALSDSLDLLSNSSSRWNQGTEVAFCQSKFPTQYIIKLEKISNAQDKNSTA